YRYKYPYEVDYFLEGESEASYIVKGSSYLDADIPYMDKASELVKYSNAFENVDEEGTVELLGTGKVSKNEASNKVKVTFKKSEEATEPETESEAETEPETETKSEAETASTEPETQAETSTADGEIAANEDDVIKPEATSTEACGEVAMEVASMEVAAEEVDVYMTENLVATTDTACEVAADSSETNDNPEQKLIFILMLMAISVIIELVIYKKNNDQII
nr:hypothetical protein [Lachnospira sp.]